MTTTKRRSNDAAAFVTCALVVLALTLLRPADVKAQWTAPDASQNITNTNTGNVGVGTAAPGTKLDVAGVTRSQGFNLSGFAAEKVFSIMWNNGVANQKVQVYWPASTQVDGIFEITVTGHYWFSNSNGGIQKRIVINGRNVGIINMQQSEVPFRLGFTGSSNTISNIMWDSTNSRYYFIVANLDNAQNGITIHVKSISPNYEAANADKLNITPIYTSDATSYPQLFNSFMSGNVGVGTSTPTRMLEVLASDGEAVRLYRNTNNAGFGVNLKFAFNNSSGAEVDYAGLHGISASTTAGAEAGDLIFTTATGGALTEKMRVSSSGNVGIGASGPIDLLHISKSQNGATTVRVDNPDVSGNSAYSGIRFYQGGNLRGQLISINDGFAGGVGGPGALQLWNPLNANLIFGTNGSERVRIQGNGNVGIGTASPGYKLDVQGGQINASNGLCMAGECKSAWSQVGGSQWTTAGSNVHYSSGNVGIGTATPATKLELAPNTAIKLGNAYFSSGGDYLHLANNEWFNGMSWVTTAAGGLIQIMGQDIVFYRHDASGGHTHSMTVNSSGNVGIGTTSPGNKLSVNGSAVFGGTAGTSGEPIEVQGGSSGVAFKDRNGTSPRWVLYPVGGVFSLYNDSIGNALSVSAAGNVGIGTGPSSNKLEVSGNLNATGAITGGTIQAKYQDVAEWVESSQSLPAGTVVVLDHTKSNQVVASTEAYDTRVAGVISAQPGITLGVSGATKVLVATTGRVRMKVDATSAPIQVGDLLVTGDREGFAMKSEPIKVGGRMMHMPGTLVGKALEPLATGTGEILVLLSLQ